MKNLSKMTLQHLLDQAGPDQIFSTIIRYIEFFSTVCFHVPNKPDWTKLHCSFQWLKLDDRIKIFRACQLIVLSVHHTINTMWEFRKSERPTNKVLEMLPHLKCITSQALQSWKTSTHLNKNCRKPSSFSSPEMGSWLENWLGGWD